MMKNIIQYYIFLISPLYGIIQEPCSLHQLLNNTDAHIISNRFWHLKIASIGLHTHNCEYPYIPHFFSLWQLSPNKGKEIRCALLDTGVAAFDCKNYCAHPHLKHPAYLADLNMLKHDKRVPLVDNKTFYSAHGTACYGIINAQAQELPVGIAPNATLFMIKVCSDDGITDCQTLIRGLKKALELNCTIVTLNVAFNTFINPDDKQIEKLITLLKKIPYVIAPSGNQALVTVQQPYRAHTLAYPAAFEFIRFDVGAFGYENNNYPVCQFSQFQYDMGPKFLEPGFNIVSTGIPTNMCKDPYLFFHGTSMAASIMAGFVSLMLAEFGDEFTKQQLLKVCYTSCMRLHNNKDWNTKCILGTLDMRTALFVLYVLKYLKTNLNHNYNFQTHFDNLLKAIHWILQYPINDFSEKYLNGVNFINNFAEFYQACKKIKAQLNTYYVPKNVPEAIEYVGDIIMKIIKKKNFNIVPVMEKKDKEFLQNMIHGSVDLFDQLNKQRKQRILKALQF